MDFLILGLVLVLFYIPTCIFYKRTQKNILEVKRGKYHNMDFLCLFCFLVISTFISVLEINEVIAISLVFRKCFDILIAFFLLICMLRHYYYALLEKYNKIRVFTWPLLIYIVFIYVLVSLFVDLDLLWFNKYIIGSFDVFSWCYLFISFSYFIGIFVVPIICYIKRKKTFSFR